MNSASGSQTALSGYLSTIINSHGQQIQVARSATNPNEGDREKSGGSNAGLQSAPGGTFPKNGLCITEWHSPGVCSHPSGLRSPGDPRRPSKSIELAFNGQPMSFDADGNMTSGPSAITLNGTAYSYDARNRLTSAGNVS